MSDATRDFFFLASAVSATLDNLWSAWFRAKCLAAGISAPVNTQPRIAAAIDEVHARAMAAYLERDSAVLARVLYVEPNRQWIVSVAAAAAEMPTRCEDVGAALATLATH